MLWKKQHLQHKEEHKKYQRNLRRWIKEHGEEEKLDLPEEVTIHTVEMTALKIVMREIQKREDMKWIIYTDSLSSMMAIKNNRKLYNIKSDI